jgi:hypothetical protein
VGIAPEEVGQLSRKIFIQQRPTTPLKKGALFLVLTIEIGN